MTNMLKNVDLIENEVKEYFTGFDLQSSPDLKFALMMTWSILQIKTYGCGNFIFYCRKLCQQERRKYSERIINHG